MASSKWKTFEELNEILNSRDYVFWGASNWIDRSLEKIIKKPLFIVDNSKLNQGISFSGYSVKAPGHLNDNKKLYIVITTKHYLSVIDELEKLGYIMGDDFCCSPLLNDRKNIDDLINHKQSILISSPEHFCNDSLGGGLYKINLNPYQIQKVYVGKTRGLSKFNENYYVIDMLRGLIILDKNFKELKVVELEKNCEPHGLAIDPKRNQAYIGCPGRDSVLVVCLNAFKIVNEYFISDKWSQNKKDNHHVNDVLIHNDSLFVSLFSFSGNWLNEVYDGGILEIDLNKKKIIGPVIRDMWMPHSILRINGKLTFLNSMLGELYHASYGMINKTNNFVRGLAYDGKYFFIGTSQHRYPEKIKNINNNISLNTGFYVFDQKSKLSKFFEVTNTEAIHSILIK